MKTDRFALMIAAAGCCALLPQPAAAQILFKSTMPDGRVVYGEKPVTGAANVEEIQPDTSKGGLGGPRTGEQERLKAMEKARLQREAGDARLQAAIQKLKDAEAARDRGKEPREDERMGTAGGDSRLKDAYFARQRWLEEAVASARRELDEVRSGK
jgi:Domain of unknown function (DUF4124)